MWKLVTIDRIEDVCKSYAEEKGIVEVTELRCVHTSPVHICSMTPSYLCVPVAVCFRLNAPYENLTEERLEELYCWANDEWLHDCDDNPYHGANVLADAIPIPMGLILPAAYDSATDIVSLVQNSFSDFGGVTLELAKQLDMAGENDYLVSL